MRISDWSSDVCSSDLIGGAHHRDAGEDEIEIFRRALARPDARNESAVLLQIVGRLLGIEDHRRIEEAEEDDARSEERRVGKECFSRSRCRVWKCHDK